MVQRAIDVGVAVHGLAAVVESIFSHGLVGTSVVVRIEIAETGFHNVRRAVAVRIQIDVIVGAVPVGIDDGDGDARHAAAGAAVLIVGVVQSVHVRIHSAGGYVAHGRLRFVVIGNAVVVRIEVVAVGNAVVVGVAAALNFHQRNVVDGEIVATGLGRGVAHLEAVVARGGGGKIQQGVFPTR